jgi:hypothetical protein
MEGNDPRFLAELAQIAQRLRDERPQASDIELDRMKVSALSRSRRATRQREPFMRSRLVITTVLVLGVLMSGAGAGLAVSGVSDDGSAGSAQYRTDASTVLPTTESNRPNTAEETTQPEQAARQLESDDSEELPFTGYAAIPVLLAGIGLLTVGVIMRRRSPG